ncbi:MAG TPA: 30S ribosomal protein S9 [Candidatus Nanoarchaeia archaeon]|nr:30S ribosomal protein S9 [Candidatus Nanoarchaeia archaeon]
MILKTIIAGKRKTAVAKLRYNAGKGSIFFNHLPVTEMGLFHRLALVEPLRIYEHEFGTPKHDFHIRVMGGGKESQVEAARVALARALIDIAGSETLKKTFIKYDRNMIVQDSRRKETRKPGDSRARSKRQKSYR